MMMKVRPIDVMLIVAVCVMFATLGYLIANETTEPTIIEQVVEVEKPSNMDTSAIDLWCGDYSTGKVRMVGAWYYTDGVVEAEDGQLWATNLPINEDDFLLLWIADNHTPDNILDDVIIKTWAEVY